MSFVSSLQKKSERISSMRCICLVRTSPLNWSPIRLPWDIISMVYLTWYPIIHACLGVSARMMEYVDCIRAELLTSLCADGNFKCILLNEYFQTRIKLNCTKGIAKHLKCVEKQQQYCLGINMLKTKSIGHNKFKTVYFLTKKHWFYRFLYITGLWQNNFSAWANDIILS